MIPPHIEKDINMSMSRGCDRIKVKTLSLKFDKWECVWCGAQQETVKGVLPKAKCQRDAEVRAVYRNEFYQKRGE
tara:strand:+ start:155 stop:379 length:225 start_codon:yes stop_codon:yes gene_type:complete